MYHTFNNNKIVTLSICLTTLVKNSYSFCCCCPSATSAPSLGAEVTSFLTCGGHGQGVRDVLSTS